MILVSPIVWNLEKILNFLVYFWACSQFLTFYIISELVDNFELFWAFCNFLDYFWAFWQFWTFWIIFEIFENFELFRLFLSFLTIFNFRIIFVLFDNFAKKIFFFWFGKIRNSQHFFLDLIPKPIMKELELNLKNWNSFSGMEIKQSFLTTQARLLEHYKR